MERKSLFRTGRRQRQVIPVSCTWEFLMRWARGTAAEYYATGKCAGSRWLECAARQKIGLFPANCCARLSFLATVRSAGGQDGRPALPQELRSATPIAAGYEGANFSSST